MGRGGVCNVSASFVCLWHFFLPSCCTLTVLNQPHNYGLFTVPALVHDEPLVRWEMK